MLEFQDITIDDKALFDSYFKYGEYLCSEMTFTNLFIWRKYYGFCYTLIGEFLLIAALSPFHSFAYFPLQKGEGNSDGMAEAIKLYEMYCREMKIPCILKLVDQKNLKVLRKCGFSYNVSLNVDDSDYVYLTDKLLRLEGKSYDGKRNHIHHLEKEHKVDYETINKNNLICASEIMENWFSVRNNNGKNPEKIACKELIDYYTRLDCRGGILLVDDIPSAITFGEMLNSNTVVIHIEKAIYYTSGVYPAINQLFIKHEWKDVKWINREQDLGIPGLRKSKQSYHPDRMIEKYAVTILVE